MQEEIKERMRQKLLTSRMEVIEALIAENNDFRSAVEDSGVKDLADIAANDIDARTLEAVGAKDRNRLLSIDAALARLENGRFGLCAGCGTRISQERLEAIPYAVMCIDCQSKSEKSRTH
ncbi:MAG: conjugal transfer protein TraR [Spirochaeta sp. LUC14_002_19_P3]|nr:MAG: conjugal transfer protein TraR [Spirochaeta sp. LUC14_002_19_P3]